MANPHNLSESALIPRLRVLQSANGEEYVELSGGWNLRNLQPEYEGLSRELEACARNTRLKWDLRNVEVLDEAGAALISRAWGPRRLAVVMKPEHDALFAAAAAISRERAEEPPRGILDPMVSLGRGALRFLEQWLDSVALSGRLFLDTLWLVRHPGEIPWREISANVHRTGGQALPITALLGLLVGVVFSYLSSQQLRNFGANIFIVNVLGIGIIRELGPMLTAVLVAGRSGSSMTAQLGVMRVTQELDALSVMGISHTRRLVLPKSVALAITIPLLILWTDTIALIGGMFLANWQLGITYQQFLHSLPASVPLANLWIGLSKGSIFGIFIGLVACHFGLRIRPNTESLGKGTTASVVTAITVVIIIDAIFAVVFSEVGWR